GAFTTSGEDLATGFGTFFTATGFLFAGARFTGAAPFAVPACAAASAYAFSAPSVGLSGPLAIVSSLRNRDSNAIAAVHNMHRGYERQGIFVQRTMRGAGGGSLSHRDITPGRILDDLVTLAAGRAPAFGGDLVAAQPCEPGEPVAPPAAGVLLGSGEERFEALGRAAGPVSVLVRGGRVDDAGDVAAARKDEAGRPP